MNKLKSIKLSLGLALSLLLGSSISTAQAALPLEGMTLDVSVPVSPPFIYITDSFEHPVGIEIDLIKEIQRRTGFKFKNDRINVMNLGDVLALAEQGKVDIAAGCFTLTEARSKLFDFSPSYIGATTALVVNETSGITSIESVKNKRVATVRGSNSSKTAERLFGANSTFDYVPTSFMGFYRVSKGLSDVMIADDRLALDYIHTWHNNNLKVVYALGDTPGDIGLLFKKGAKINPILQETVSQIIADGTMDKIIKDHTGERYHH